MPHHGSDTSLLNARLKDAVLQYTDPLHATQEQGMGVVLSLLNQGACAYGIMDAMVARDEWYFEAVRQDSLVYRTAVRRAVQVIPLLAAHGDKISPGAFQSAKYNCDPAVQRALQAVSKVS